MRASSFLASAMLVVSSGVAFAQAPGGPPAPSPEQKRLGYFVGKWHAEGEVKPNAFMPAGKMISEDSCTWFAGEYAVVCRSKGTTPMGPGEGLAIMGYSAEEGVYTYYAVDNSPMSMTSVPRGKVTGADWVYDDEAKMGGKVVKSRYTVHQQSPTAYTFAWEVLGDDGSWKMVVEGRSTKR